MRKLIYNMYYTNEISIEVTMKLLEKLEQIREKKKY